MADRDGGTARHRVYALLEATPAPSRTASAVRAGLVTLILLSTATVIVETVPAVAAAWRTPFRVVEVAATAAFAAEYLLRLYACTVDPAYRHPVAGRLRFALRPVMLLDLVAVLPLFLGLLGTEMRIVRLLRLLRLLRAAKLGRYSSALAMMGRVVRARSGDLTAALSLVVTLFILASSAMHVVERDAQPDKFGSIPASMWWAIITITTVGYGDVYPVTHAGRALAACIAVLGITTFALPTSIFVAEFMEQLQRRHAGSHAGGSHRCPHCGAHLDAASDGGADADEHADTLPASARPSES